MTEVQRNPGCGTSPAETTAEKIALALMGVGTLAETMIAEAASWERPSGGVIGRAAILAAAAGQRAETIEIDQVVTRGRAGTVSGRVTRSGGTHLFCHVIRYTSPAATEIAQLVSFDHPGGA